MRSSCIHKWRNQHSISIVRFALTFYFSTKSQICNDQDLISPCMHDEQLEFLLFWIMGLGFEMNLKKNTRINHFIWYILSKLYLFTQFGVVDKFSSEIEKKNVVAQFLLLFFLSSLIYLFPSPGVSVITYSFCVLNIAACEYDRQRCKYVIIWILFRMHAISSFQLTHWTFVLVGL